MTAFRRKSQDAKRIRERAATRAGFTFIEMMIAMAVASILLAAVYAIYGSLSRSYTEQNVSAEVQQSIRATLDLMAEDIMMAGLDPTDSGQFGFETSDGNRISFRFDTADADNIFNGVRDDPQERINYEFVNSRLLQCFGDPPCDDVDANRFIENVTAFDLVYLDGLNRNLFDPPYNYGPELTGSELADIRQVDITISVTEPAGTAGTVARTYSTRVRCRNIRM